MRLDRFAELRSQGPGGRQAGAGVLEHQRNLATANASHGLACRVERREIYRDAVAVKSHPLCLLLARRQHQTEERVSCNAFAAPALAYQPQGAARVEREADVVDRPEGTGRMTVIGRPVWERHPESLDLQDGNRALPASAIKNAVPGDTDRVSRYCPGGV